jgi:hypothetical protein
VVSAPTSAAVTISGAKQNLLSYWIARSVLARGREATTYTGRTKTHAHADEDVLNRGKRLTAGTGGRHGANSFRALAFRPWLAKSLLHWMPRVYC